MIPITAENDWLTYLGHLPLWACPLFKTVILSPHPDDELLGVGGLIADLCLKNIDIKIIAVTDGEHAYSDVPGLAQIRRREQIQALRQLGVPANNIVRLGLKDGGIEMLEKQLEQLISPLIDNQTHLFAPWTGDFHPDHEAVGRVATKISQNTGALLSYYFFWTWHHSTITDIKHLPLGIYPLAFNIHDLKIKALDCYASQLFHHKIEPILPEHLLAPAKREFEVYCNYSKFGS